MLGEVISDPLGSECGGSISGMGILKSRTVFGREKVQTQTKGHFRSIGGVFECLSGAEFSGYEIHMGTTESSSPRLLDCGGACEGNVYGCYIHGIFDAPQVSERIVKQLFSSKGLAFGGGIADRQAYKETQFDMLAEGVRNSIDTELLYRIIKEGI
jgi:adenosylcobyric acid synthase